MYTLSCGDPFHRPIRQGHWIALGLFSIKSLEIFVLWKLNATILCWITASPWFLFFVSAVILQFVKASRSYNPDATSEIEIPAGDLYRASDRRRRQNSPTNAM